ncbi:multidrug export protein EmrA, partial [Escherichia coli]
MEQINSNKKHSNRRKYFSLLAVVLFIAFSGAYAYWSMELEDMISTDDAYVTGNAD